MNLFQFCRVIWARRMVVLLTTVACFVAGALASLLLPRSYVATSRVMIDVSNPDPSQEVKVPSSFARGYIPTEAQVIADYRVSARAAENLGWTRDPSQQAAYRDYRSANAGRADVLDFDHWIAQQIMANVSAKEYQNTNFIDISYTAPDANDSATMANAVRQAYIDEATASKRRDAVAAVDVLDRQMDQVREQREAAEQKLIAFQRATGVVLLDNDSDADSARLQALASAPPSAGSSSVVGGVEVNPRAAQIAALDARIAGEAVALGPNHPLIQELRRQRAALVSVPVSEGGHKVSSGPSYDSAMKAESDHVLAQRDKIEEAKRLAADVQVQRELYQQLATRVASLRQEAITSDSSIIPMEAAVAPTIPASPKIPLILGGSAGFGLVAGLLIALITEFMRRRVRGVEDLSATEVPIIGVINAPRKNHLSIAA